MKAGHVHGLAPAEQKRNSKERLATLLLNAIHSGDSIDVTPAMVEEVVFTALAPPML